MMFITKGAVDVSLPAYFVDDDGGTAPGEPTTGLLFSNIETGGSASYQRQGEARVDLTLITQTVAGAHSDGGFIEIDATNMPGLYRVDFPDAAFASGADFVIIQMVEAGANNTIMRPLLIMLTGVDLQDTLRGGMSALPAFAAGAAGGLPDDTDSNGRIRVVSGTGAGELSLAAGLVDFTQAAADKVWSTATRELTAFSTALALNVWHVLESAVVTASTMGLKVKNNLDAVLSARTLPSANYFDPSADTVALDAAQGPVTFTGVANEAGLTLVGQGTGPGLRTTGGVTGHGIDAKGGATSGDGMNAAADGDGKGISAIAVGANAGVRAEGGATGPGIHAHGGATGATPGVEYHAHSASGNALDLVADGTGGANAELDEIIADTSELQTVLSAGILARTFGQTLNALLGVDDVASNHVPNQILRVETFSELPQAQPPVTPTMAEAIVGFWMTWRNDSGASTTERKVKNDAGVVQTKAPMSDDGTDFNPGKLVSGP